MIKLYRYIIAFLIFPVIFNLSGNAQEFIWNEITKNHSLYNDLAEVILETDAGLIWFGTKYSGLWVYDGYDLKKIDPAVYGLRTTVFNSIRSLYETPDKKIWIGTDHNGVIVLDPFNIKAHKLKAQNNPEIQDAIIKVNKLYQDENEIIWMATHKGLVKYNINRNDFQLFKTNIAPHRHNNLSPSLFREIKKDPGDSSILWLGGINGLFSFNTKTQVLKRHMHPLKMHTDIGNMNFLGPQHRQYLITQIEITGNSIFLATWGGGILEYRPENKTWKKYVFQPYTSNDALDENIVNGMVVFDNKLFFSSVPNCGYLNLKNKNIQLLDNPLSGKRKNFYTVIKDKNNDLLWSTYWNGIYKMKINKDNIKPYESKKIIINSISFGDFERYSIYKNKFPDTLIIPPQYDSLSVSISLINPLDTNNVEYQYQLSGIDHGWMSNGISRNINYSNLPKGKYYLKIRAGESGGKWIFANPVIIHRKVYFYKTIWFWSLTGILFIVLAYFIYKLRISSIKKKAQIQNQITELKLHALQAQMNPHFTFNALNSINSFIMSNKTEEASDFLTKFSRLIRQILNISKEKIISLEEELKTLTLYIEMEQMRFADKFDFSITVSQDIDPKSYFLLPLTIQPYVENAIWHGLMHKEGKGFLQIIVSKEKDHICFEVIDNGIGMKNSRKYQSEFSGKKKSFGMSISKNRLEILNKLYNFDTEIIVEDLNPQEKENPGTRVSIKIPVIRNKTVIL